MWAGAAVLGAGGARAVGRDRRGAAGDYRRRPLLPSEKPLSCRARCRQGSQAGCCVMLEAQLAESGDSRERASWKHLSALGTEVVTVF